MIARQPSKRTYSLKWLAEKLGLKSDRGVRRYWAEPRRDYEKRSFRRNQPWLAEGISRSTWYRRKKALREKIPMDTCAGRTSGRRADEIGPQLQ